MINGSYEMMAHWVTERGHRERARRKLERERDKWEKIDQREKRTVLILRWYQHFQSSQKSVHCFK